MRARFPRTPLGCVAAVCLVVSSSALAGCGDQQRESAASPPPTSQSTCATGAPAATSPDRESPRDGDLTNTLVSETGFDSLVELHATFPASIVATVVGRQDSVALSGRFTGVRPSAERAGKQELMTIRNEDGEVVAAQESFFVVRPVELQVKRSSVAVADSRNTGLPSGTCLQLDIPGGSAGGNHFDSSVFPETIQVGDDVLLLGTSSTDLRFAYIIRDDKVQLPILNAAPLSVDAVLAVPS